MKTRRVSLVRGAAAAAALLAFLGAAGARAQEIPAESPAPADSAAADPLQMYLRTLSDSSNASFRDPVLESLSISDATVDSLLQLYEETGETQDDPAPTSWRLKFGIAGARYNRVEGLNVMPRITAHAPVARPVAFDGRVGYAWSAHDWTGGAGVRAELARRAGRPTVHVSWAQDLATYGSGLAGGNSLTALTLGRDWGDYFRARGWTAGIDFAPGQWTFGAAFRAERQESLPRAAAFNFFDGDDAFRPNPAIDDGRLRLAELDLSWGALPGSPWAARLQTGAAGRGLGGDFEYETARGELTMRRRVFSADRIVAQAAGGWVDEDAPFQALHHLGGFETLRGYDVNEFSTRAFTHLRADYEVGSDPLRWAPWVRKLRIQPVAFADAAAIFEEGRGAAGGGDADENTRLGDVSPTDPAWRFSAGIGLQKNLLGIPGGAGQIRFDVARRFDRGEDTMTYRARIMLAR